MTASTTSSTTPPVPPPPTTTPRTIDVSELPGHAFGPRSTAWWGTVLLLAIEGTMFLLLLGSYLYVRPSFVVWPPVAYGDASFHWSIAGVVLLLLSVAPMHLAKRAAPREKLGTVRAGVVLATVCTAAFLVTRALEYRDLGFRWDSNTHASIFWLVLAMHTGHGLAATFENLLFAILLFRKPVEKKLLVDVEVNTLYWYFVTLGWVPLWAVLYLEQAVLG